MQLTPLHTRMISLRCVWGAPGALIAEGRIFDLRKRGILPLAGRLRGPGVVHDMSVRLELSYPSLQIRGLQPTMAAFPYLASNETRGEGCPDRLPDVQGLLGASLREDWGTALLQQIGGPLGCFHIFTLLRLLGPTLESVADREQQRRSGASGVAGSPICARSIVMDGMKGDDRHIILRGVLSDLYYRPNANALPLEEEMEEFFETTAELEAELPYLQIGAASVRCRRSGPELDSFGPWNPVPQVSALVGRFVVKGYTAHVQQVFADGRDDLPVQHLLFMMAPTFQQCMPSMAEELDTRPRKVEGPHPSTDSCHMFRRNGPLMTASGEMR